jgi:2-C-methyl-D-erythritol 4-phosphate cytidylyltransferase
MDSILLAAGLSRRMGQGIEKQLARIGGKPTLLFSIEVMLAHPAIKRIILTYPTGNSDRFRQLIDDYSLNDKIELCAGGVTRQESTYLALQKVQSERVLIHEAARPLITRELIDRVLVPRAPAVVPTWDIPFTVAMGEQQMIGELDRSKLKDIQLPQVFDTSILKEAHERARVRNESATEDSTLVFRLGHEVKFVAGLSLNLKITYPIDLIVAEQLLFGSE